MIKGTIQAVFQGRADGDPKLAINRVVDFVESIPEEAQDIASQELFAYVDEVATERRGRAYPPKLENQKYIRTFAMQAGYDAEKVSDTLVYYVQKVDRRRYVVDREYQAAIHQGRHQTMQEDIENTIDGFTERYKEAVLTRYAN